MAYRNQNGPPTGSPSALVFVSRVILISLGLALIGAFLAALPRAALVLLLELASAGLAGMGVWILARQRGAPRRALENEQRSREAALLASVTCIRGEANASATWHQPHAVRSL